MFGGIQLTEYNNVYVHDTGTCFGLIRDEFLQMVVLFKLPLRIIFLFNLFFYRYLRGSTLGWMCGYGHKDCVKTAQQKFSRWRADPNNVEM